jgi:P pilus assembly protein, pilin FimA
MKCLLPLLTATALASAQPCLADSDMEIKANIVNTSCEISLDNNGSINLGTVSQDYFANNETPDDILSGGQTFYVKVKNCAPVGGTIPSKMTIHFAPLSGSLSPYSNQVFANEDATGPQNVGVVIFSTHDAQNIVNVMNTDGTPRSVYDVTPADYTGVNYSFYARMQKIVAAQPVTGGGVKASVLVSVYYE